MAFAEARAQQLSDFLEVVKDAIDPDHARAVLESAEWNLQEALIIVLEGALYEIELAHGWTPFDAADAQKLVQAEEQGKSTVEFSSRGYDYTVDFKAMTQTNQRTKACRAIRRTACFGWLSQGNGSSNARKARSDSPRLARTGLSSAATDEQAQQARLSSERREEIAMQDAEFQASLLIDQQLKAAEEARLKEAEEAERRLEEARSQAAHEDHLKLEAKRARVSRPEPDRAHPDRCQIGVRTPSGQRLSRTFLGSDDTSFLYAWVDVACDGEAFAKNRYLLVSSLPGQPSKELPNSLSTLEELGVEHQTVLNVMVLD